MKRTIRIGTRKSPLAVAQAIETQNRLLAVFPDLEIKLVKMQTTGDAIADRHLAEIGGKGLFTKEIETALRDGDVDIAVHSMKDMPDTLPDGMVIDCILEREDPRDAFISLKYNTIDDLPNGATVGTSSLRRQSQLLRVRPDLNIVQFRGNVQTRLDKLKQGLVDATFLATAGLNRLGMSQHITQIIDDSLMLPAVSQGAIGVECMMDNAENQEILSHINHRESNVRVAAERGFLKALNGNCSTPIAALCNYKDDGTIHLRGLLASDDGVDIKTAQRVGNPADAWDMGFDAGNEIKTKNRS